MAGFGGVMTPVPCLGPSCPVTLTRVKSLPLCKAHNAQAWRIVRARPVADEFNAESRRNFRFWSNPETVRAALAAGV